MNGMSELPTAVEEKLQRKSHAYSPSASWTRPLYFSIPGVRDRHLRILVPNWTLLFPSRGGMLLTSASASAHFPSAGPSRIMLLKRRRGPIFLVLAAVALLFTLATLLRKRGSQNWGVEQGSGEPPTLVFRKKDLQQIWEWEIESGHYPSHANSESSCPSALPCQSCF
jgi:WD repeat and SOF domain-containing protein 1